MSSFARLLKDPAPQWAFELSESGIAFARRSDPSQIAFQPLAAGVVSVSPVRDNVQQPDELARVVAEIAAARAPGRHRRAALILPDYAARVGVLDFDAFPAGAEEQRALIRFRMRKAVPFDLDSAVVSHYVQRSGDGGRIDVVVAVVALDIVARYEAPFRAAGFEPGEVTTSTLAALNMVNPGDVTIVAKLSGMSLSVAVLRGSVLKLARCVDLENSSAADVAAVLHPTVAFIEDELKARPKRLLVCGMGALEGGEADAWREEWGVEVEPLRSKFGTPSAENAGVMGYMEAAA